MKFTLSWLKDHLETDASLAEIVERLTAIGLEVEHVDDKAGLKPFVIAKVLTAVQHPDADRLRVLTVDTGDGKPPVQVVCGAPNARAGLVGAFAAPGTYIPGIDVTLSVGKIRGVESHGMMCSERELQLSDEHTGIIDLPEDAPVGTSFAAYAHLDDPVIEINLTPNRPDATSVYGIARDLAASGLGRLTGGAIMPHAGDGMCPVKVKIEAPELCPGFALTLVKGVKNGPSPKWLQQRLIAIGLRPISALVDITNYVTFDRGRPLHVFDAKKVTGNLVVRRARDGENVLALDGREYSLTPEMCVIADDNGIESIAGIMGGEHSGCDENTTDVLIESALWDPITTARTGRTLGIISDARYRFERGVDPEFMVPGVELATKLVLELCGGTPTEIEVAGYAGHKPKIISFPLSEVKRLTGIEVPREEALTILTRLGFEPRSSGDAVEVKVPSWRPDVDGKADLVEEVMRIHGVDNIAPQPLTSHDAVNGRILTILQVRTRAAKRALAVRGMMEAVTWSFIPAKHAELFGGGQNRLKLAKADAIAALEACGAPVDRLQIEPGGPAWYHPGRSGTIKLGPKTVLGTFGEFHPKTLEVLDASGPLCGFEVFVDAVPEPKAKPTRTKPKLELSPFQAVKRDFAFVVDRTVEAGTLVRAALAADKKLVTGVSVFDVFEGAALGAAKKSIAIEVSIQPVEKTLTDEDFEALAKRIVENVNKQTGGVLRA
ncbi:phenylalanine--tRNA ligase subunit beta [Mesorhizobium sp.]|uniref:phenylalanine--tRNA ligase subunit beta n=1 Tax=Mesorhizobium sp. TaxID=1871066 RepID=UPI000FE4DE7B|nr:phenylalanine--tRNA ligase subunit beta [Mesorhizobium sp.]RWG70935.1 MAG: phenylalanine--tRNA ligase subunit beta [Mesorhizobium sp.]